MLGIFESLMLINWICHTKSELVLFLYTRNLLNKWLNPVFEYKSTIWICVIMVWIHKGYCVVKKLLWNIRIKSFVVYKSIFYLRENIKFYLLIITGCYFSRKKWLKAWLIIWSLGELRIIVRGKYNFYKRYW